MSQETPSSPPTPSRLKVSLDWWAVITALVLAALVLLGVIPSVPW